MATSVMSANAAEKEHVTEDMNFMEEFAGQGLDTISSNETAMAYLGLVQPDSSVESEECPAGTWRNSATGRSYGPYVKVVPIAFRTIWSERESVEPFRTVARYVPNTIEVEIKNPPAGKRGYPKMTNPQTGNEIKELYVYAVVLPDYPEDGVLFLNPNVSSMRTCKSWNSQLKGQILPSGQQAPIFAYQWDLVAELVANPQQKSKLIAIFSKAVKGDIVSKGLFESSVKKQLVAVNQTVLQLTSGALDEPEED